VQEKYPGKTLVGGITNYQTFCYGFVRMKALSRVNERLQFTISSSLSN
jgi:hypothetical protein